MGNCPRKAKRGLKSCLERRRTAPAHISQVMTCPRCRRRFEPYTTYEDVNQHMDNCMNDVENGRNQQLITIQAESAEIKVLTNPNEAKRDDQFYWVKKESADHTYVWVKEKAQNRFTNPVLSKMPLRDASKLRFEDKKKWFRLNVEGFRIPWTSGADILKVDRDDLLKSSLRNIKKCNLFKEVKVEFKNDEKVNDAGGLLREWMSLILKELVKPESGIFIRADNPEFTYTVNPKLDNSEPTLDLFEFAGRVIGKALFERVILNIHLDNCTLKYLVGKPLTLEDLQSLDTPLYNSLVYLRDNTIDGSDIFQEYFVVPSREGPVQELCPDGAKKLITDKNKHEYIQLLVEWFGLKRIERKLSALLNGVATAIPIEELSVFDPKDLDMMIAGVPFIDVGDWEANTIYKASFHSTHNIVRWFWQELKTYDQKQLAIILQFCTGSSRIPVEGFRALESNRGALSKFCIESTKYVKDQSFITAHTCFNRIVVPLYPNAQILKDHLKLILQQDFNGVFGIE